MTIPAPTGHVTFAFTDVEGSTGLWEQDVAAMQRAIELHDELTTRLLEAHEGYLIRTEGDSVKAAFASPVAAVRWCVALQQALLEVDWPAGLLRAPAAAEVRAPDGSLSFRGLRVRMGVHPGLADARVVPATGRVDYFGPDVNTAARVADAPHGGQIIVSGPTWEAVASRMRGEVACRELGEHELKGVALRLRLLEVSSPALSSRTFPAPRTRSARRTNVSSPGNDFVGRDADLQAIDSKLSRSNLVTVLGPGGTGKTRLVRELGVHVAEQGAYTGGVWFVDLAAADERGRMITAVAAAASISLPLGTEPEAAVRIIGARIARLGPCLLILDNLEQIVEPAAAAVRDWLAAAPELRILATSRAPLGIETESVHALAPLAEDAAVSLFIARARERGVELPADPATQQTIHEIVEELDGLALAVELAAARTDVLSVEAIRKRLSQRFRLLSRSGDGRHDTMRSALDWSWDLLDAAERTTLAQCSVFDGGFTVDAAEAVVDLGDADQWPMDVVQSLRSKSLLVAETVDEERRLNMLRIVRAYAAEKLRELGGEQAAIDRHAQHFVALAKRCADAQFRPHSGDALLQLRRELDNILAVWTRKHAQDPRLAATIVAQIGRFLVVVGGRSGVAEMFDAAIEAAKDDPALHVDTLLVRAYACRMGADVAAALVDLEAALEIAKAHDLPRRRADVAQDLGATLGHDMARRKEAAAWIEQAIADYLALGELGRAAVAHSWNGIMQFRPDPVGAERSLEEAARLAEAHAGTPEQVLVISRRFLGALERNELDEARAMSERAFAWHDRLGSHHDCCSNLVCRGVVELASGRPESAQAAAQAAAERITRLDAPGLAAAALVLQAAIRATAATSTHDSIDGLPPDRWYAHQVAPYFKPGPPDDRHPEGTPPLAASSIWCNVVLTYVERFVGLVARLEDG